MLNINTSNYNNCNLDPLAIIKLEHCWRANQIQDEPKYKIDLDLFLNNIQICLSWLRAFKYAASVSTWSVLDKSYLLAQLFYMQHQLVLLHYKLQGEHFDKLAIVQVNIEEIFNQIKIFCCNAIAAVERANIRALADGVGGAMQSLAALGNIFNRYLGNKPKLELSLVEA